MGTNAELSVTKPNNQTQKSAFCFRNIPVRTRNLGEATRNFRLTLGARTYDSFRRYQMNFIKKSKPSLDGASHLKHEVTLSCRVLKTG